MIEAVFNIDLRFVERHRQVLKTLVHKQDKSLQVVDTRQQACSSVANGLWDVLPGLYIDGGHDIE